MQLQSYYATAFLAPILAFRLRRSLGIPPWTRRTYAHLVPPGERKSFRAHLKWIGSGYLTSYFLATRVADAVATKRAFRDIDHVFTDDLKVESRMERVFLSRSQSRVANECSRTFEQLGMLHAYRLEWLAIQNLSVPQYVWWFLYYG